MRAIITLILTILLGSNAAAYEERSQEKILLADIYQNIYNWYQEEGIDNDTVVFLRDRSLWYRYGRLNIGRSEWINDEVKEAWIDGHRGQDVDVIVLDNHTSRMVRTNALTTTTVSHGQKVSAILGGSEVINGKRYIGIAPEANIIKKNFWGNSQDSDRYDADIVNMSFGGNRDRLSGYWYDHFNNIGSYEGVNTDALIVKSSGNGGGSCLDGGLCSFGSIELLNDRSDVRDQTLIVGAIDDNNNIKSYSNKAGITKDFFVVDTLMNTQDLEEVHLSQLLQYLVKLLLLSLSSII